MNKQSDKPRAMSNFRATGFMIDVNNNLIVTNAHVITEAKNQLFIEDKYGEQFAAKCIYVNFESDIAFLKITDSTFKKMKPVPYSINMKKAELGENVFILGFPKQEIVYVEGYISALNGHDLDTTFCQLSTLANEGNSGSPVINNEGEIVGVISGKENNSEGVVYAIKPINIINGLEKISS